MIDAKPGLPETALRPGEPLADEVSAQVERILASSAFAQSARLQKLLRYIVEETLSGRSVALKEYTIALDVFERGESFNPQTSSVVRVEVSRLRAKLERYYATEGRNDAVRVVLPPGGYVPVFQAVGPVCRPDSPHLEAAPLRSEVRLKRGWIVALLAAGIVTVGTAAFLASDFVLVRPAKESSSDASRLAATQALAVLPLRDLSSGGTEDYFSDGITDALITRLAKGGSVRVTSMTSALRYKNADRPVSEIARELGVSHIIEGSVLRVGDKVRIAVQLIEADADRLVWADSYERDFADVLALQDEVVGRTVAALSGPAALANRTVSTNVQTINPAAYEAHLKGRYFLNKMTEEGFRKGIVYFGQAIEKAPEFAPAYSGIATCYCLLGGHGFELVRPSEGMPAAKKAVLEALRLDESLAEAHAFLGIIRLKYEWDWPGAEVEFQRSIALDPSYAQAHIFYSFYLEAMGRQDEAIREAEAAKGSDPLSLAANVNLGWQYVRANRLDKARQVFEDTAELDPTFWGVHWGLGQYYRRKGNLNESIEEFRKAIDAGGGHAMPISALGYTYAIAGQPEEAYQMLEKLNALAEESYVSPFNMAIILAGLSEKEEAFEWLEKAYEDRSRSMAWLNVTDELNGLRSDPSFESLKRRIGLP